MSSDRDWTIGWGPTGEIVFRRRQRRRRRIPAPREAPVGYWRGLSSRVAASGDRCCSLRRPEVDTADDSAGGTAAVDRDDDCSADRSVVVVVALDEVAVN